VGEPDEETFSESNTCEHNTNSFLGDKKDNVRTVPEEKEKATGPAKKRRGSKKNTLGRLLYRNDDAALACGVKPRTWRTWSRLGLNPKPVTIGKASFWRIDELEKWVEAGCPRRCDWSYRPTMDAAKKLSNFSG